ncbi:MAG: DNA polymerase III subunit delta' [Flavobacteriaceae bacterium]|nr:DNA polymerase III subunit delta' [Flavobacteriaceae bacterium]
MFVYLYMLFNAILGHDTQKKSLADSLSIKRIPHAQLFEGDDGHGLLTVALAYANTVVCGDNPEKASMQKATGMVHPDIHFIFPTAITSDVKTKPTSNDFLGKWRNFVFEKPFGSLYDWMRYLGAENKQGVINVNDALSVMQKVSLKPFEGGWKCVIIWHAEKLTVAASNKLLKSIEEPPAKTLFLLLCPDAFQLIATVRSRCQQTSFGSVGQNIIAAYLEKRGVARELSSAVAGQSGGNVGKALGIVDQQNDLAQHEEWFVAWVRTAFRAKGNKSVVLELAEWSQSLASKGIETQKQFLSFAIQLFRAALMNHYELGAVANFYPKSDFKLKRFAAFIHGANILPIITALEDSVYHLSRNGSPQMIFTELSFKLTRLLHTKE